MNNDMWQRIIDDLGPQHPLHERMVKRQEFGLRKYGKPVARVNPQLEDAILGLLEDQLLDAAVYFESIGMVRERNQTLAAVLRLDIRRREIRG